MKKILIIIPILIMLNLAGCGKKETIIVSELSSAFEAVKFSEQLTQIDTQNIEKRYSLNSKDYKEITAFVGTASTCDEYVIAKTDNPEGVSEKFNKYIENKREEYEIYRPNETYKLDSVVIETYNDAVVMVVTADSENARNVYEEYLKK